MSAAHASDASDASLLARTREGDEKAYAELWRRHSASALTVARSITSSIDHDDLVQEAFVRVFTAVRKGGGPKGAFRPYLFTTLRNTAAEWGRKRRETSLDTLESFEDPSTNDAATEAALDRGLTAQAFRSLPTRWQEVLWYSEVEQMTPAEIGPLLGMKANGVAALTYRAREGLRQAWIQAHINAAAEGSECRWSLERMGSYAREALGKRDTARFDVHLDECAKCTIVVAEAKAVGSRIALVLLPLTIGATGASAYLAWLQSGQTAAVMAMPAGITAGVGIGAPTAVGAGAAASGGSGGAGGGGAGGGAAGAGSAASGLSAGAIAVGGTVIAGVLAAAVAAAVIFIPAVLTTGSDSQISPPQAAGQPPSVGDPDDDDAAQSDDSADKAPPADDVPDEKPPADDIPEDEPPADDPPADDPPADDPPADDPGHDESTPPSNSDEPNSPDDNETIAPTPPPDEKAVEAPTRLTSDNAGGTSYPVVSGKAAPGSEITVTVEPTEDAASTTSATETTASFAFVSSLSSPLALVATESMTTFTAIADESHHWSVRLDGLGVGKYTALARAKVDDVESSPSDPLPVEVAAGPTVNGIVIGSGPNIVGVMTDGVPGTKITIVFERVLGGPIERTGTVDDDKYVEFEDPLDPDLFWSVSAYYGVPDARDSPIGESERLIDLDWLSLPV